MACVSILLPCYQAANTLPETLASITHQHFSNFEVIAINDGSTDETLAILKAAATNDERIRVFDLPHQGIVAALNFGLEKASCNFIARMDADDVMHAERLQLQVNFLQQHPETGLVSSLVKHAGNAETQAGYAHYIHWINGICSAEAIAVNRFVESPLAHPSVMFRSELITRYGNYRDGNFPEDYELWLRWLEAGVRMEKIETHLLDWNDLPSRLSRTDKRYDADSFYALKNAYLIRFLEDRVRGRRVWLCGAGRIARKHSQSLRVKIQIAGFIDIDPQKIGRTIENYPVIALEELGKPTENYVISYVGNRHAREWIANELMKKNFIAGEDFVLAG
jgi:glycosyltransferase involved in cell wall biosynthesis